MAALKTNSNKYTGWEISMLLRTVIISTFGANSSSPAQSAVYKLGLSCISAVVLGFCAREFIRTMGISSDLPPSLVMALMTIFGFLITGLVLFSFGASGIVELRNNDALKVLTLLPVTRPMRYVLHNISALLLALFGYVFLLPAAIYIAGITSVSGWRIMLTLALGCLSCFALVTATYTRYFFLKFVSFGLVVYGMGRIVNHVFTTQSNIAMLNYVYLLCGVCLLVAVLSAVFLQQYVYRARLPAAWLRWPRFFIVHFWFAIKFLRNKKSQTSFMFSFIVLCLTAWFVRKNSATIAVEDCLRLIAFMTMAVFCDARITFRKYKSLEAHLGGVESLVRVQLQSLRLLGVLLGLPLLFVVLATLRDPLLMILTYIALQSLAVAIGVLSGGLFASTPDNTGGQLLSVIIGGCLLYVCLLAMGRNFALPEQALGFVLLAVTFEAAVWLVELKRQRSYGYVR